MVLNIFQSLFRYPNMTCSAGQTTKESN